MMIKQTEDLRTTPHTNASEREFDSHAEFVISKSPSLTALKNYIEKYKSSDTSLIKKEVA